jgi:drug/metabolite transporter (DMT)-like permease
MSVSNTAAPAIAVEEPKVKPGVPTSAYLTLVMILLFDAFASSIVRLTLDSGMPPLAIAGLRLPIAWAIFTPIVLRRYGTELRSMSRLDVLLTFLGGILFTAQIVLIFYAIDNTTILVVHVTFSTGLLWVAALEKVFLKAHLPRLVLAGLVCAFVGSIIIGMAGEDQNSSTDSNTDSQGIVEETDGDSEMNAQLGLLAGLAGSAAGAAYLIIGRKVRENVSSMPYIWGVFGSGSLLSISMLFLTGTPATGYSAESYFWLLMLLLVVQFGVHAAINYVVGYLPATFISVAGQSATFTASIVAFILFSEVPKVLEVGGGLVILTGVVIAVLGQRNHRKQQQVAS